MWQYNILKKWVAVMKERCWWWRVWLYGWSSFSGKDITYDDDNDGDDVDEGVSLKVLLHPYFHNPLVTNKE